MALVNMRELLVQAKKSNYCIGAFSIANMEMVMGAIKAAEELHSPIIIQIAEVRLKYSPLSIIGPLMVAAAKEAKVPVAVHLDHGATLKTIKEALDLGFTSIMYDGSSLPLKENIENTNEVIDLARKYNAAVEGEVGVLGKREDGSLEDKMLITTLEDAKKFYTSTKVDALAVSIGNAHGQYKDKPNLQFKRLREISDNVEVPLVLHGGSGITLDEFRKCIENGIKKINVATATFNSVVKNIKYLFKENDNIDYFTYHNQVIEGAYKNIKGHIEIFKSHGKA